MIKVYAFGDHLSHADLDLSGNGLKKCKIDRKL